MMPIIPSAKYINKNCVKNIKDIESMKNVLDLLFFSEKIIIGTVKMKDTTKTGK